MARYTYTLVDVFTDRQFAGNQLAVFTDARGMPTETMQAITREFNFSECTFVLPPFDPLHQFKVRIFNPASEMKTAGHPTIGTAFVLALMGKIAAAESTTVIFEEGVGPIPVEVRFKDGRPDLAIMDQPLPIFGDVIEDRAGVAALLGVDTSALDDRYPMQFVSSGVPFVFVAVKDRSALGSLKLRRDVWERDFQQKVPQVFMFTADAERPDSTVRCRMFAPAMGIAEDPATGIAHGPLGAYLHRYGIVSGDDVTFISEQGFEMGRPSLLTVILEQRESKLTRVRVGGQSQYVGEGVVEA
jgi:trans-2,3-dihydro-3-hydroxyanthranilate isomerase